jgi:hypothetical protein
MPVFTVVCMTKFTTEDINYNNKNICAVSIKASDVYRIPKNTFGKFVCRIWIINFYCLKGLGDCSVFMKTNFPVFWIN